jgi:hypothetical protein
VGLYSKTSFDLLCEQVNRDNPELEVPFSRDTVVLLQGPLTDNLGSSNRNTRAIFNGIQGSGINGKREVFFDRINITKLYGPAKIAALAPATAVVVKDMLASLNELLGLKLTVNDLANPDAPLGTGAVQGTFTLTIHAKSVSYTGSLVITWTRAPVGTFPQSGPGTKVMLFGSLEAGYFGIVPESELFNKVAFYNAINDGSEANVGDLAPESPGFYFKFAYKNRFLFVPATPLIDNISWLAIYNKSGLYGPTQKIHNVPDGTGTVDQSQRIINVKEQSKLWQLKPKLAAASQLDPATSVNYTDVNRGGEWYDLFRHTTKLGPSSTGAWDDKTQLGEQNHYEWVMNTFTDPKGPSSFGFVPRLQTAIETAKNTGAARRWRPVFEVVNDLNLIQGVKFGGGVVTGRLPSIVLNVELPPITERLVGIQQFKGTVDAPAAGPVITFTTQGIFPLKNVSWETDAKAGIGQVPPIAVVTDAVRAPKSFSWTTYELPSVNNVTITR